MDDHLQEMAARAQVADLQGLFQVIKGVALKESIPSSDAWRTAPSQIPAFLNGCVKDSGAGSAEAFVLGPDLGPISLESPMLIPDGDREELQKWFGFYSRAFGLRKYVDEPHPQTTLEKKSAELVKEISEFITWRLRAYAVKKPF